jgi:glycosyltransferase involved in cell wall biosynthesis
MAQTILEGFRQAAHVIAVSNSTRDEIMRHRLFPPELITVIPNGVHPSCSAFPDPGSDVRAAELMPDLGTDSVWLLSVGSTLPRKRLDVLLRVFAAIRQSVPKALLVRVGGLTPAQLQLARELSIEQAVLNLPFLERDVLAAVYRRATLLLHPAEAEGFGLPLIEAMACGCPVVASDLPVLREVGATAACYCPVADVDEWTRTAVALLGEKTREPDSWELRRHNGRTHAARFSWTENARQTALIYKKVLLEK